MAFSTQSELIEIETTLHDHSHILEYQEFIPDFREFIHELSLLERKLFQLDTSTSDHDYGKSLVNRIYFSWLTSYLTRKFRSHFVNHTENDREFQFRINRELIPEAIIMPTKLLQIMTKTIQCYKQHKTNELRIPMIDPHVQVSSNRYSTATATIYKHVYIPFEYDTIPDPGILTHLFHLIREREIIFRGDDSPITTAVKFLLTSEVDTVELHVTDKGQTIEEIFNKLMFHVFLDDLPDCTPEQLVNSVDNVPTDMVPPLSVFSDTDPLHVHTNRRTFNTIPPREWFNRIRTTHELHYHYSPDVSLIGSLPGIEPMFQPLPIKTNKHTDNLNDLIPIHGTAKPIEFWLNVFTAQ